MFTRNLQVLQKYSLTLEETTQTPQRNFLTQTKINQARKWIFLQNSKTNCYIWDILQDKSHLLETYSRLCD